jgi:lactate dehydrogenase-like 2-hydroxyacid dehydrogenase/ubiquinone/menaquinone biosynthesis C-methylase UbiE
MTRSIVFVSDHFHFSHFYWKSSQSFEEVNTTATFQKSSARPPPQDIKLKLYSRILHDDENNIHFGKWDHVSLQEQDAYSQAAHQMTDYMYYDLAMTLIPEHRRTAPNYQYIDLGSGTGASAIRIASTHKGKVVCLNVCPQQNRIAQRNVAKSNLHKQIQIVEGDFEQVPFPDHAFDLAFSQDAFIHAHSKIQAFREAFRLVRQGGAFVFCDVMAGPTTTDEQVEQFAQDNAIPDLLRPEQAMEAMQQAGWKDVHCRNVTTDMRISFQLMLQKVLASLETHKHDRDLLEQYCQQIQRRIDQIDRGFIQWCVFYARKPVVLQLLCQPPLPLVNTSEMIVVKEDDSTQPSVVVVDILTPMPRSKIEALPSSVSLLITMSAGLDHIDVKACHERNISVQQAGRHSITSHVAQYALAFILLGLRDALSQQGVPFPSPGWNLTWNIPGKPLEESRIALIGMGTIAKELVRQVRCLAPDTEILYHVQETSRNAATEAEYHLQYYADLKEMASKCDILVPLCPLTEQTRNLINDDVLSQLPSHAGLLNLSRGGVVDTEALTQSLQAKQFRYAILDTTAPEPLPPDHPLWSVSNCFIFPHFATNTMAVRRALVQDIQPLIEDYFDLAGKCDDE